MFAEDGHGGLPKEASLASLPGWGLAIEGCEGFRHISWFLYSIAGRFILSRLSRLTTLGLNDQAGKELRQSCGDSKGMVWRLR